MSDSSNEHRHVLARRVVACKGWRWMPGMLTLPLRDELGEETWPGFRIPNDDGEPRSFGRCLPNLDDPATLGCLLALVREAWGGKCIYTLEVIQAKNAVGFSVRQSTAEAPHACRYIAPRETEAEALIAALEAAP